MIRWKAAMKIHFHSHSSSPIPWLLFPLQFLFPWYSHCHPHSHGNPMWIIGSQLFPFPCTCLLSTHMYLMSFKFNGYTYMSQWESFITHVVAWEFYGRPLNHMENEEIWSLPTPKPLIGRHQGRGQGRITPFLNPILSLEQVKLDFRIWFTGCMSLIIAQRLYLK